MTHTSWILTDKQCTRLHTNSAVPQPQHLWHNTTCGSETTYIVYVFILDLNSLGPDDGPIRTETCSPTINKVYIGHLLVVLDGCFTNKYKDVLKTG